MTISLTMRRISDLSSYTRKLRFNDNAVSQVTKVLGEFGLRIPLLTNATGEIIDGHPRLKAAMALGMSEVPTIVCDDWSVRHEALAEQSMAQQV